MAAPAVGRQDAPDDFRDPIMDTLMVDPVDLPSGHTIDRPVVQRMILESGIDPFSRQPLALDDLVPNTALKDKIDRWKTCKRNGEEWTEE